MFELSISSRSVGVRETAVAFPHHEPRRFIRIAGHFASLTRDAGNKRSRQRVTECLRFSPITCQRLSVEKLQQFQTDWRAASQPHSAHSAFYDRQKTTDECSDMNSRILLRQI